MKKKKKGRSEVHLERKKVCEEEKVGSGIVNL